MISHSVGLKVKPLNQRFLQILSQYYKNYDYINNLLEGNFFYICALITLTVMSRNLLLNEVPILLQFVHIFQDLSVFSPF